MSIRNDKEHPVNKKVLDSIILSYTSPGYGVFPLS